MFDKLKIGYNLLLILLLVGFTSSAFTQQECLVQGSRSVSWLNPNAEIQAWCPDNSNLSILKINLTVLEKENGAKTHQIQIYKNFTILKTDDINEIKKYHSELKPGWLNFIINIYNDNVTIEEIKVSFNNGKNDKSLVLSYEMDSTVIDMTVMASNLTVNCISGRLIWRIRRVTQNIPLAPLAGLSHLAIYSQVPVLPSLRLPGGRSFTLGLFNGSPTTLGSIITRNGGSNSVISTDPLPPYVTHHFTISCVDDSLYAVKCHIMMNSEILETGYFSKAPTYIEMGVVGGYGRSYLLIQYTKNPPIPPINPPISTKIPPTTLKPATPTQNSKPPTTAVIKDAGWSVWWVFVALGLAILLVFIVIMCVISHYHRPKIEKYFGVIPGLKMMVEGGENDDDDDDDDDEDDDMETDRRPLFSRSISLINTHDPKAAAPLRLWNAVASGTFSEVKQVVDTLCPDPQQMVGGRDTSAYMEAHHRGHVNVLRVLEAYMKRRPDVPQNEVILTVLQAHSKKVEEVFGAAMGGQYRHSGGVDVLIRAYSLPGTIQDSYGQSLLHYAASMALADSGPLWLADDIRSLVDTHGLYVNAVDFKGRTALHALSEKASMSEQHTCWDGRTLSVCDAWLALADLLLKLGVNPTLPDHTGTLPSHIAQYNGNELLADLLFEAQETYPAQDGDPLEKCRQLVEASSRGDVAHMSALLNSSGGTVLPLGCGKDPLLAAVQNGHRDAVFLLVCAGAPLCAYGLLGNTPFQAAHMTLGLPALFPALIRKVFCDQLECEAETLSGDDQVVVLREGLRHLRTIAELSGHRLGEELSTWLDRRPASSTSNYVDMMALAARNGLTLTCQLLGVAGVPLNPLPDQPHPLGNALEAAQCETAYSLCRDLKMNPYALTGPQYSFINSQTNSLSHLYSPTNTEKHSLTNISNSLTNAQSQSRKNSETHSKTRNPSLTNTETHSKTRTPSLTDSQTHLNAQTHSLANSQTHSLANSQTHSLNNSESHSLSNITSSKPRIPDKLLSHLVLYELQKLEVKLSKKEIETGAANDLLKFARGERTERTSGQKQLTTFLYLLAELDLVTILHRVRLKDNIDVNLTVHEASGATMLHVASAYGKLGMVEYLLGHDADHTRYTRAGLAPVHLAALRGHRACMKYIMEYTRAELGCSFGLTPSLMFQHFTENVKSRHLDLLTVPEATNIKKTKGEHAKTRLILAGRCSKLGIKSSRSFWEMLCKEERKFEKLVASEMETLIQNDVQRLCDQISLIDGRFKGNVVLCSPLSEKVQLLLPENFDFFIELEGYSGLENGCIKIKESSIGNGSVVKENSNTKENAPENSKATENGSINISENGKLKENGQENSKTTENGSNTIENGQENSKLTENGLENPKTTENSSNIKENGLENSNIKENGIENSHTVQISSSKDPELFINSNFKAAFSKAAHEALVTAKFKSLALIPPFLAHTSTGVCIHAAYRSKKRVMLVRVCVTPAIKVPGPEWLRGFKSPAKTEDTNLNDKNISSFEHSGFKFGAKTEVDGTKFEYSESYERLNITGFKIGAKTDETGANFKDSTSSENLNLRKKSGNLKIYSSYEHLINLTEGNWVYHFNLSLRGVLKESNETQRRVLQACLYLRKLLETCWWLPKQEERSKGRALQTYPVGVTLPETHKLLAYFLEEVAEGGEAEGDWSPNMFLDKVIGVFKRCSEMQGCSETQKCVASQIVMPRQWSGYMNNVIEAIVQYLIDIKLNN